jgi:hypothetical protein
MSRTQTLLKRCSTQIVRCRTWKESFYNSVVDWSRGGWPEANAGHDAFAAIRETIRAMNIVAIGRMDLPQH